MRSFCGVSRPARSCPRHPPRSTVPFPPPPSPRPPCSRPRLLPGVTPPLIATAAHSRLSTSPPPTDQMPIKICPQDQPLKGPQPIRIAPLARPHPHTEPLAVILHPASALCRDKLAAPLSDVACFLLFDHACTCERDTTKCPSRHHHTLHTR